MRTLIADHPLIDVKLTLLRDVDTATPGFVNGRIGDKGFILPGLGDAGERPYGVV